MTARRSRPRPFGLLLPAACALLWVGAFIATHIPADNLPRMRVGDKTLHAVAYFALAAVFLAAMWSRGVRTRVRAAVAAGVLPAYGALDELTQPLVNRSAAWGDWAADLVGIAAAILVVETSLWLLRRRGGDGVDAAKAGK